ncbi:unnamed protein product [Gemmata massiliana]|uniref:Uncharacterized protein n=1 Tax=Gemmata massiliana TaxID=1210884 RepID=A0A6P2D9X5_9BACT|nr:unnamed protein product [Gemmata massiliana]
MPKHNSRPKPPTYRLHRPTNTARCWINGAWKSLGAFGSPESHDAFAKVLAEFRASPGAPEILVQRLPGDITVDEVALAFWRHAEQHYRRADGTATNELALEADILALVRHRNDHRVNYRADVCVG